MDIKKILGAFIAMVLRIAIAIFVLYYLYQAAIASYNFGYRIFADLPCAIAPGRDIDVTLTESMDNKAIAQKFEEVGLVDDWKLFFVQILLSEYKEELKPGLYKLNNSMNSEELLEAMAGPKDGGDGEGGDNTDSTETTGDLTGSEPVFNQDDVVVQENDTWYEDDLSTEGEDGNEAE